MAQLRNLNAFTACHRLAALRTGRILSFSELARDAALPVTSARRDPLPGDLLADLAAQRLGQGAGTRRIESPRLLWFDPGVQRTVSGPVAGLSGEQYESAIIALWSLGARLTPL